MEGEGDQIKSKQLSKRDRTLTTCTTGFAATEQLSIPPNKLPCCQCRVRYELFSLQFRTILFPYKLFVAEKKTYAKGTTLKFPIF